MMPRKTWLFSSTDSPTSPTSPSLPTSPTPSTSSNSSPTSPNLTTFPAGSIPLQSPLSSAFSLQPSAAHSSTHSAMATSAQLDRRKLARHNRVLRACDSCRHSHVKCDAAKPTCNRCKQTNKVCCYTLPEPEVKQVKKYISLPTYNSLVVVVSFLSTEVYKPY